MKRTFRLLALVLAFALALAFSTAALAAEQTKVTKLTLKKSTDAYEYQISYPRTGVKSIDDEIKTFVNNQKQAFVKRAADDAAENEAGYALPQYTLSISFKFYRPDGDNLSFLFTVSAYYGGAHPNTFYRAMNFSVPKGEQIELDDIFAEGWEAKLAKLCEKPLCKAIGAKESEASAMEWLREGLAAEGAFHGLVLTKNGVTIGFDDYQVGPYVVGAPVISLSNKTLASLWKD